MQLTDQGRQKIDELARRYGVSTDAVMTMLQAVVNGNGSMAQFSHPELGGGGQWMRGGMTMVGDMFNYGLKAKVDGLCCGAVAAPRPAAVRAVTERSNAVAGWRRACSFRSRPAGQPANGGRPSSGLRTAPVRRTRSAMPISTRHVAWRWTSTAM